MALKQFDVQLRFKRVNMADDSGMMNTQRIGRSRNRAQACDMKRGFDFIPIVHNDPVQERTQNNNLRSTFKIAQRP
jgi:hypothetical protein